MLVDDGTDLSSPYTKYLTNSGAPTSTLDQSSGGGVVYDLSDPTSMYISGTAYFSNDITIALAKISRDTGAVSFKKHFSCDNSVAYTGANGYNPDLIMHPVT